MADKATKEERFFLLHYYEQFENEPTILALMDAEQKNRLKEEMAASIFERIGASQYHEQKVSIFWKTWSVKMAAAILLIALSVGLIYFSPFEATREKVASVHPDNNKNRFIRLPDGSTVIVSVGSRLDYPSSFDGLAKREVYLEGQAYFDIRHDPDQPFIIHTGVLKTTVLGTAFNIRAWSFEDNVAVTVTRGKVKVGDELADSLGVVLAAQQLTYNKKKARAIQQTVTTEEVLVWKNEDLLLEDVTVAEAVELLGERFGVDIICEDDVVASQRFTTTFLKDEPLEQILNSIATFNDVVFFYESERATAIIRGKDR